ncbi:hypothetical protein IC006_0136 [Sulfuracidifex tepidarius]|uniref:Uncharacterized protein n=1 Tax=Sulfuracidifex tepidarius TaxID=1294262 RepID=A0A510DRR2_9CREN|nr:hypothetical protein [Sulfuracidifex tepidarius]BBG22852.1 hypothetical protein IC006_0136 [Sulfuracidifex tepidarius]
MNGPTRIILIVATVLISLVFFSLYSFYGAMFTGQANVENTLVSEGKSISVSFSPTSIVNSSSYTEQVNGQYLKFEIDVLSSIDGPLPWYIVVPFVQNGTYNLDTTFQNGGQNATIQGISPITLTKEYIPQTNSFYSFTLKGYNVSNLQVFNITANMTRGESLILWVFTEYDGKFYRLAITYLTPNDESIVPPKGTVGLELCTNIYVIHQDTKSPVTLQYDGNTIYLSNNSIIITPIQVLPKVASGDITLSLPQGTVISSGGMKITLSSPASLNLNGNAITEDCIYDAYLPFSSFFTGYQSDNDNIGTTVEDPNPELESQTLAQWFVASGNLEPITLVTDNNQFEPNYVYITKYPPAGGYLVWTGDAGLIVGAQYNLEASPNAPGTYSPPYYVAFTVHLSNGEWATIVSTQQISDNAGEENGQSSSPLELAVGVYNASNGEMTLLLNNTVVSEAQVPSSINPALLINATSIFSVGAVYNGSNKLISYIPGMAGDYFDGGSPVYSFNGALGPTLVYGQALTKSEAQSIYQGDVPDPAELQVVWTQNTAQYVKVNPQDGWTVQPCYDYSGNGPGGGPGGGPSTIDYCVPNLADTSEYNGLWGLAGAIPTSFAPFSDLVLWGGVSPLVLNPSLLLNTPVNVTSEYSGIIAPQSSGVYNLSVNFTDPLPGATVERSQQTISYANEYAKVYLDGKLVFVGKFTQQNLQVLYSNDPYFLKHNIPEFQANLSGPANISIIFSFNMDNYMSSSPPPPGPPSPPPNQPGSSGYPVIYFGMMWQPPGAPWFQYIPLSNLKPLLV